MNSIKAKNRLANFTYYENYIDLTRLEVSAITSALPNGSPLPQRIAFLGSGPLPLSSICLLNSLQTTQPGPIFIQNVDWDPKAIAISSSICQKLGIPKTTMAFSCCDAARENNDDLKTFDVVILAALVGRNDMEKKRVMRNVIARMSIGSLLVIRSAHSLRRLLYPAIAVSVDMAGMGLKPVVVVHPYDHVVNSVVVGRIIAS